MIEKKPQVKATKFLAWTRKQLCSVSYQHGSAAHHLKLKGVGGIAMKADDYLVMPLLPMWHDAQHETGLHKDVKAWEKRHGPQTMHIRKNLNNAYDQAIINHDVWVKYTDILDELEKKQ